MVSDVCTYHGRHNWGNWSLRPEDVRVKSPMWYVRECQQMGCDARQYAEHLLPVGQTEIVIGTDTEELLATLEKKT